VVVGWWHLENSGTLWFNEVSSYIPLLWFPTSAPVDMNLLGFLKHSNITIPLESLIPSRLQLVRYSSYCCWFWDVLRKTWMHYCILFVNELCGVFTIPPPRASYNSFWLFSLLPRFHSISVAIKFGMFFTYLPMVCPLLLATHITT
jgi:hypothetical protein